MYGDFRIIRRCLGIVSRYRAGLGLIRIQQLPSTKQIYRHSHFLQFKILPVHTISKVHKALYQQGFCAFHSFLFSSLRVSMGNFSLLSFTVYKLSFSNQLDKTKFYLLLKHYSSTVDRNAFISTCLIQFPYIKQLECQIWSRKLKAVKIYDSRWHQQIPHQ